MKTCPVCGEKRHEKDSGFHVDVARVKAVPRRLVRAVKAFWAAAVNP